MENDKVLIEIPKPIHNKIVGWANELKTDVSEFLRLALIMGVTKLAEDFQVKEKEANEE